ncbi:hypothetical protein JXA48_00005 [Candidatus Woesearchaeota archaeon]|nr:hypothetical protein [Candidatus Woesearchaeota archaeon]
MLVIGVLLLLATPLQRSAQDNPLTPGEETYSHLNNLGVESLSFYDLIIHQLSLFLPLGFIIIGLPLLLAIISSLLFYLIIRDKVSSEIELYLSLGILFLTPAFITMHLGLTVYSLILALSLAIVYTYKINSRAYLLFLFLLYLTMPFLAILFFVWLFFQTNIHDKKTDSLLLFLSLGMTVVVGSLVPFVPKPFANLNIGFFANEIFNFLGGTYGFVLFSFALGFIGLYLEKNSLFNVGQRTVLTLVLVFSLFYEPLRIVFIPFLAFFAAKSLNDLMSRDWSVSYLKELTVILFICMLLFATLSGIKENTENIPTVHQKEAYLFLQAVKDKNIEVDGSKVLTNPTYGEILTYFSKLDAFSFSDKNLNVDIANSLLKSRDYSYIKSELQKEKIAFVYVDEMMMQGNILERPDQGILFVMEHNDNFKLIYSKNKDKIYYFTLWNGDIENAS